MDSKIYIFSALCFLPSMAVADSFNFNEKHLSDTSRVYDIDEVIIASRPKDIQRLRRQAVSSTSLSASTLSSFAARDLRDVSSRVPSFVMPAYGSRYTSSVYVRGIGARVNSPAVGMYVDDIPLVSKSAFNTHIYDISRIDMLRGPQGTLYGQNAEGGLIRIYTKSPLYYQGTDVQMSIGNHFWRMAQLSHYGKAEGLGAYSVSAFYNGQNGFQHNQVTGKRADNGNEAGARLKLIRQQTARTMISLTADYQWVRQNGFAYGEYDVATGRAQDPSTNLPNNYRRHLLSVGLNVNYKGRNADINSTTSYQYLNDNMQMDQDYTALDFMQLHQRQLMNAVTQEFAIKNHDDNRWRRVTGAFFSYQWLNTDGPVGFGESMTGPMGNAIAGTIYTSIYSSTYNGILNKMIEKGMPEEVAKAKAKTAADKAVKRENFSMGIGIDVPGTFRTPQLNAALFHESSLQLSNRFRATLGLRYDLSRTSIHYDTRAIMTANAKIMGQKAVNTLSSHLNSRTHNTFNQLLPKLALTYDLGKVSPSMVETLAIFTPLSARATGLEATTYRCSPTYCRPSLWPIE